MRPTFALIHTWPDLRNAEYEVLHRVLTAAERCAVDVIVIDNNGVILWATPGVSVRTGDILEGDSVDFVLALHFLSPRVVDAYSYVTLWQPTSFYVEFNYDQSIDKVRTHNDLLSCASDIADAHGLNLLAGVGRRPPEPLIRMFHAVPEPYLEPSTTSTSTLFYIGINWERVGRQRGRFHDTLISLDSKGLVDIYGPEDVLGVAPWEGFASYRGELPFDGESVKHAINRSGICLALSSSAHKATGIMSNRLFEGLAGGAAVIASPNPLIDKYFSDVVYLVDDQRGEQVLGQQILETVRRIRDDPAEARRRTTEGQRILRETCSLEGSIRQLVAETPGRAARFEAMFLAHTRLTVCLIFRTQTFATLKERLGQIAAQKRATINLHVICDIDLAHRHGDAIAAHVTGAIASLHVHPIRFEAQAARFDGIAARIDGTGAQIGAILKRLDTPYFAILNEEDVLFSDHFASLGKALEDDESAMFACSGMLVEEEDALGKRTRTLDAGRFTDLGSILLVENNGAAGRFLYRSSLIDARLDDLIVLLDGEEHAYFRLAALLAGPLAQTGYSSYLVDQTMAAMARRPVEPIAMQRQYIRDTFARDPRFLDRLLASGNLPPPSAGNASGTPVNWEDQSPPALTKVRLAPNQQMPTRIDGAGMPYLVDGFSIPESDFTWIEDERGTIEFTLRPDDGEEQVAYSMLLHMHGRRSLETGREQHCTFALNGKVIGYHRIPESDGLVQLAMPMQRMGHPIRIRLEIIPDHADPVVDGDGQAIDARKLGVALASFELRRDVLDRLPLLAAETLHGCGKHGEGLRAMFAGFYNPEDHFTWLAGAHATLRFRLTTMPTDPVLHIRLRGRASLEHSKLNTVTLTLNGIDLGTHRLSDEEATLTIALDGERVTGELIWLNLELSHAEAVYNEDHKTVDGRLLGAQLIAFGVFAAEASGSQDAAFERGSALTGDDGRGRD